MMDATNDEPKQKSAREAALEKIQQDSTFRLLEWQTAQTFVNPHDLSRDLKDLLGEEEVTAPGVLTRIAKQLCLSEQTCWKHPDLDEHRRFILKLIPYDNQVAVFTTYDSYVKRNCGTKSFQLPDLAAIFSPEKRAVFKALVEKEALNVLQNTSRKRKVSSNPSDVPKKVPRPPSTPPPWEANADHKEPNASVTMNPSFNPVEEVPASKRGLPSWT